MELEFMEEFSGPKDRMIVKGKRTKRPRLSSSTSSNGGGAEFCNSLVSSPSTSSEISTTKEEDEDMANCLILLSRGNSPPQREETKTAAAAAESEFSSRRFAEMAATMNGKIGIYVYECKTCNRTFPSCQALGGHRASHKKHKTTGDDDQKKSPPAAAPSPDNHSDQNKPKIHACSICGSEFASGQALGGHMRRHRPPQSADNTASHDAGDGKPRNMLVFDLNLPAPLEDEKFEQLPARQQPRLVLSAAALVDCYY